MLSKYVWFALILVWITLDLLWWRAADARLARVRGAVIWRLFLAGFMGIVVTFGIYFFVRNLSRLQPSGGPTGWQVLGYLWHLGFLPFGLLLFVASDIVKRFRRRRLAKAKAREIDSSTDGPFTSDAANSEQTGAPSIEESPSQLPTRRRLLGAAAAALPPLASFAMAGRSIRQLGEFRLQRRELFVPGLPHDLAGLTIAHVSDLHLGKFLPDDTPARVAEQVNALQADFVAFTGDLIDTGVLSRLPEGIDFMRRLDPRNGLLMIEGNHDLMEDAALFEQRVLDAGLPLMLDEARTLRVPGRATPVQFFGISWGEWQRGRDIGHTSPEDADRMFRQNHKDAMLVSVSKVAKLRDYSAFPILLAHHPHAFDPAAAHHFPLTLAGHTHGGQIMLTEHLGAGPIRFKYWTGLYAQGNSRLFISNGIGNWFPVRLNAPAEIIHLTLRRAEPAAVRT